MQINLENKIDYKILFESTTNLHIAVSPDLKIVAVNNAYLKATMKKREDILGKDILHVFPNNPSDSNSDYSNPLFSLNSVLENKKIEQIEIQKYIKNPKGILEKRYWSIENKPILNEKNEIIYILKCMKDITKLILAQKNKNDVKIKTESLAIELTKYSEKNQDLNIELEKIIIHRTSQLERALSDVLHYKFAIDTSCIVAITNQNGIIQHANDNFCKISKFTYEELINQDHRIINSGYHSKEFMKNLWETITNGKVWKGEMKNKCKDGTFYWVDTTIVPFIDSTNESSKFLSIRTDISKRKEAEQKLLNHKEELEVKVLNRTIELSSTLAREKEANEIKSRFVSFASHEFRTPLSAILSSASLIEKYKEKDQDANRLKHTTRISSSVRNLNSILNNFLSLTKIEKGYHNTEKIEIHLPDFFKRTIKEVDEMVRRKNQKINYCHTGETIIEQSAEILQNIILNLLTNAIKYSLEGKKIQITSFVDTKLFSVTVKDYGIGLSNGDQKKIFSEFFRAENVGSIEGTGLGLCIVKRYVEVLEGDISFVSKLHRGTSFTINFPI